MGPDIDTLTTAKNAAELFEEMRKIAIGFVKRTSEVEQRLNYIVATVYVNVKKRAEDGDEWSPAMVTWLDEEIAKVRDLRERYLVAFAATERGGS